MSNADPQNSIDLEESESFEKTLSDQADKDIKSLEAGNSRSRIWLLEFMFSLLGTLVVGVLVIIILQIVGQKTEYVFAKYQQIETNIRPVESDIINYDRYTGVYKTIVNDYSAKSIYILDLKSNTEVFSKNPEFKTQIASLTKLASSYVQKRSLYLNDSTEIKSELEKYEGSALVLKGGQKFTNEDLLKAMIIASSNQAAYALDQNNIFGQMNELSKALELTSTNFANPAGYDDVNNYSDAKEVATLAKLFFSDELLTTFAKTIEADIIDQSTGNKIKITNTNDLLRLKTKGVVAGKTGTTLKAAQNLVLLIEKNNRLYIAVILNSIERYEDAYKILERLP